MDWTEVLNQLIDILLPILATFLTGLFTYLGAKLKAVYEQKVQTETAEAVIKNVVKFIQQTCKDLDGEAKLKKAISEASTILASKGIELTETEINMLIESAVYGLKEGIFTETVYVTPEECEVEELTEPEKDTSIDQLDPVVKASEITE